MILRPHSLLPLCCTASLLVSLGVSLAEDEEPYDPTSPEHVAEREEDGDMVEGEGVLSGPAVESQPSGRSRGGGGAPGSAGSSMGEMNALSIFSTKCQKCHGPQKQKGGVQLLPMEMIFSGSKEHWFVQKGDPEASELMRRITLPAGHDDIMPPEGGQLTKAEVEVISEWIRTGAPTDIEPTPRRQQKTNPRLWARTFLELELTEVQRTESESQLKTYQALNATFDQQHRMKMRELQQEIRQSRDSNDTIANASMKQELQRLQAERPKFELVQEDLWALLTPKQQEALKDALAAPPPVQGMGEEGSRGRSGAGRPGRPGGSNSELTEEERARLRKLMQERRRNGQGRPPRGPAGGGGGGDEDGD